MKNIKDAYKESEFFTPKKSVDTLSVEEILKTECFPVKTVNRKTYRNVFEGFKIVVDDSSAVFSTEEL